jgi:transposase
MASPTLLPDPTCLHLKLLDASEAAITAVVMTTSEETACPLCHSYSARIHSHYVRAVADLPWMGCAVRLELHVRCFFCPNAKKTRTAFFSGRIALPEHVSSVQGLSENGAAHVELHADSQPAFVTFATVPGYEGPDLNH